MPHPDLFSHRAANAIDTRSKLAHTFNDGPDAARRDAAPQVDDAVQEPGRGASGRCACHRGPVRVLLEAVPKPQRTARDLLRAVGQPVLLFGRWGAGMYFTSSPSGDHRGVGKTADSSCVTSRLCPCRARASICVCSLQIIA